MKRMKLTYVMLLAILCPVITQGQDGLTLMKQMLEKNKTVKTLTYTMIMQERVEGKYIKSKMFNKIVVNPLKVYLKQEYPDKDLELLFVTGWNDNKCKVKKNRLLKLSLDPYGSLIRKNQHNTIYSSGFTYTFGVMDFLLKKYGDDKAKDIVKNEGLVKTEDGTLCYKITLEEPNFKYFNYVIRKGETISTVAKKYFVSEYMILENNPQCDWYDDVKEGQIIKVPEIYCKKMVLYLNKNLMMPAIIKLYDDKGLFEQYEFHNMVINPNFAPNEFNPDFPGYGF